MNADAMLEHADWTKQSWDLPIDNVADLRKYIAVTGMTVAAFKRLPVYQFNVGNLAWLKDL